ncbi:MAG TPA: SpoIIE family protein phosphatase [Solirubrobacteraceae bacterium]
MKELREESKGTRRRLLRAALALRGREGRRSRISGSALEPPLDDLLQELLEQIGDILEADTAVILLRNGTSEDAAARTREWLEQHITESLQAPSGRDGRGRAALVIADVPTADGLDPALRANGVQSLLAVPLLIEERYVGLLVVGNCAQRSFSEDEAQVLEALADRVAVELQHGGVFEHHRREWALQRSLLPEKLPAIPGIWLTARFLPASALAGVGGGWYDAFPLPDGRVGLAVGDVACHGAKAATLMGELRNALRAYAVEGDPPATVASKMWHFVATLERGEMATFLYALYDPSAGTVRFYSAGHPPPLFVHADGKVTFGATIPAAPLGVGGPPRDAEAMAELPAGTTMLLYTDGLAERPGERLASRRARIAESAAGAQDPDSLCSQLLGRLVDGDRPDDDVVLLAVQAMTPPEDALLCTVPAVAEELLPLRRQLRRWLAARGANEREIAAVTLATQEACANAVEHAYGLADATFHLAAVHHGPTIEIVVRDRGKWRPPRGENRGRGMALMRALVDDVEVVRHDGGTTVRLVRTLEKSAPA